MGIKIGVLIFERHM